jgi:HIP---CoA ligase
VKGASIGTIPAVLRNASVQFAEVEAVVDGPRRRTFSEVANSVTQVEHALIGLGVGSGDRVAIWAPNGLDWIVLSFAVYGVGAVLVPVNTRFKGGETAHLLETAEVDVLFTVTDFMTTNFVDLLRIAGGLANLREVIVVSGPPELGTRSWSSFLSLGDEVEEETVRAREEAVGPNDPSDIIFTSGTTGQPKGAVLRHGASVETYVQWSAGVGIRPGDRMLVVYPFFHTAGLKSGILASFITGVTIVPHPIFDPVTVAARVSAESISVLPGPPSIFQALLSHPEFPMFDLQSVRLSVTGAAVVPVELIARMRDELGLESVITAYGLTETHGTATICERTDSIETIATTVGHPLTGLEVRVVDEHGSALSNGLQGEVLIRGFNVMSEYFMAPETTSTAIDSSGWLHTGDVGVMRDDGYLKIVDRLKDIIIVGGFNVSPAEVESVLLHRDDVAQAAVVGAPDSRLGEVGVAFVVPPPGRTVDPIELASWCREYMANYKVPRRFHVVDSLPMNPSGKIVKSVLREQVASTK